MTRTFENFESYASYYESHPHKFNDIDMVKGNYTTTSRIDADGQFECKSWKTAIKRFAKATGWNWVLYELENTEHSKYLDPECDSVSIENVYDNVWYIAARQYI